MRDEIRTKILRHLADNRIMSVATLRPDGWPQATIVGYASEGLTLYFVCGKGSQKAQNLALDGRVSLTIGRDTTSPFEIEGLSMAARARPVDDRAAIARALGLMAEKYPEYLELPDLDMSQTLMVRVAPTVISVLDYRLGFGHADLVEVEAA